MRARASRHHSIFHPRTALPYAPPHPETARDARAPAPPASWLRLTLALALRAAVRPALAADLLRVAWRFRSRHWYRRFPFLPLPARDYVRWRMHTAYGTYDAVPPAADVERYARWVGRQQ
jgi:hypothetical protein